MSGGNPDQERRHRVRAIRRAVTASLFSKGGSAVLQLAAIPLAFQVLGPERFGLFGLVQTLMWILFFSDLGMGAGMGRRLTQLVVADDRAGQRALVSSAFGGTAAVCALVAILGAVILTAIPVTTLFGAGFSPYSTELRVSLALGGCCFLTMMLAGSVVAARGAWQEIHTFYRWGAVANLVSAFLLITCVRAVPQVWFLVLAVYGAQTAAYLANGTSMLLKRPWLRPSWASFDPAVARSLLREGLLWMLLVSAAPVIQREGGKWLLGWFLGPAAVGAYSILIQLGFFMLGIASMVIAPLGPAVADARARGDLGWVRRQWGRLAAAVLVGCAVAVPAAGLVGPRVIPWWLGSATVFSAAECALFAAVFGGAIWVSLHLTILFACGAIGRALWPVVLETAGAFFLSWLVVEKHGICGVFSAMLTATLCTSAWSLPVIVRGRLQSASPA